MRVIDANALREKAQWMEMPDNQGINCDVRAVSVSSIDLAPTIEAEPVRHGQWVYVGRGRWECSECKHPWPVPLAKTPTANYCPNCGAKMDLPN